MISIPMIEIGSQSGRGKKGEKRDGGEKKGRVLFSYEIV